MSATPSFRPTIHNDSRNCWVSPSIVSKHHPGQVPLCRLCHWRRTKFGSFVSDRCPDGRRSCINLHSDADIGTFSPRVVDNRLLPTTASYHHNCIICEKYDYSNSRIARRVGPRRHDPRGLESARHETREAMLRVTKPNIHHLKGHRVAFTFSKTTNQIHTIVRVRRIGFMNDLINNTR